MKEDKNFELILVGDKKNIKSCPRRKDELDEKLIYHASQVIEMVDKPIDAIKSNPIHH